MYEAFVTNDTELAIKASTDLEQLYSSNPSDSLLFKMTYAQQTALGFELEDDQFDNLYDKAKENAQKLVETSGFQSYGHTFLASIYASQMGRSAMSAMFLAPKNKSELKLALEADENNALAWLQFGGYKYFAPGFFGGDLDDAIEAFERSVALFESTGDHTGRWSYLGALNLLRRSYSKSGREADANKIIDKARSLEPRLKWVKTS